GFDARNPSRAPASVSGSYRAANGIAALIQGRRPGRSHAADIAPHAAATAGGERDQARAGAQGSRRHRCGRSSAGWTVAVFDGRRLRLWVLRFAAQGSERTGARQPAWAARKPLWAASAHGHRRHTAWNGGDADSPDRRPMSKPAPRALIADD